MKEVFNLCLADFTSPLLWLGGVIGAVAHFAFGEITEAVYWLLIMAGIDWCMGNIVAIRSHDWSSDAGWRGLTKKALMLLIVGLCHGLDTMSAFPAISCRDICAFAYGLNELGSIFENLELLGYGNAIPAPIRTALAVLKAKQAKTLERLKDDDQEASI